LFEMTCYTLLEHLKLWTLSHTPPASPVPIFLV
jgi:hypothetical protein